MGNPWDTHGNLTNFSLSNTTGLKQVYTSYFVGILKIKRIFVTYLTQSAEDWSRGWSEKTNLSIGNDKQKKPKVFSTC